MLLLAYVSAGFALVAAVHAVHSNLLSLQQGCFVHMLASETL
jgi:hypothetical protein